MPQWIHTALSWIHWNLTEWCRGRVWWYRIPLLAFMAWIALTLTVDRDAHTLFSGINLGIHEMGHMLLRSFGETLHAFGGTLLQCLAPLFAMIILIKANDWFGPTFCFTWLGTNFCYVAGYMADARARVWPLLSVGGGEVYHDWEFLFDQFGLLNADTLISGFIYAGGIICLWGGVASGAWMLWFMRRHADE